MEKGRKLLKKRWIVIALVALTVLCGVRDIMSRILNRPAGEEVSEAPTVTAAPRDMVTWTPTLRPTEPPESTATATVTPKPMATLTPVELLQQMAQGQFGDGLRGIEMKDVEGTTCAVVAYNMGAVWDESWAVRMAISDFEEFALAVFAIDEVGALKFQAYAPFTDVYGKESTELAFEFIMMRETAEKIRWDNVNSVNVVLILELEGGVYVHSALEEAWMEYRE